MIKEFIFLLVFTFAVSLIALGDTQNILKETIRIPMRDGIRLGATVYRPTGNGKYPAIVFRTPYSKDEEDPYLQLPIKAAKAGYIVLLVDVRGRYTSEGEFVAYENEKQDGYDTIEWVAKLPYCNGNVGTYGRSYRGYAQWLALSQSPPSLKTAVPEMTPIHSHQFFYVGGAFSYSWFDWFMPYILPDLRRRAGDTTGPWDEEAATKLWQTEKKKWYEYRPLIENPLLKEYAPYYYEWLTHPEKTDYWNFASAEHDIPKIKAPVLLISGWFDSVYGVLGATEGFRRMKEEAGSAEAREQTRLILGPWNHGPIDVRSTTLGVLDNGPSAGLDYDAFLLHWFDHHLKGMRSEDTPPVRYYVMGANRWRYGNSWPPTEAISTSFYLHRSSPSDSGSLQNSVPAREAPDSYVFDPANPLWDPAYERSYPYDQREMEARKDVLVYTSDVLAEDVEVSGQIIADLFVASSAKDTDFAITLCDVFPDGASVNLSSMDAGYLRMRFRNGNQKQEWMDPEKIYNIKIDNLYTSNLFRKGHRIRLQITSSKMPHYDPNTNTGTDLARETRLIPANQIIYHDSDHPSRLILPVMPPDEPEVGQ